MARYKGIIGENSSLTEEQKAFVKYNSISLPDDFIALNLGVSVGVINYYRRQVLGIIKGKLGIPYKLIRESRNIFEIEKELKAIQQFGNYPSLMNGAKERVKYLESVLNGVR